MERLVISGGKLLTPKGIVDPGTLVIEGGIISEILAKRISAGSVETIEAADRYVLPGFVNLHSDCIETEMKMQRRLLFPISPALTNLDRKLASWGITSEFHAINFSDTEEKGRSVALSGQLVEEIIRFRETGNPLVDHFVHVRCDPSSNPGTNLACKLVQEGKVQYASLQEHTPGVGRYRDLDLVRAHYAKRWSLDEAGVASLLQKGKETRKNVYVNEKRFAEVTSANRVPLASHDDDTEEKVEYMHRLGIELSEFPLNLPVALKARSLGLSICMGAPNAFRGQSQMDQNISARQAIQAGVVDILCSDYYPPSLAYATFTLAREGFLSLNQSLNLVTFNPARFIGKGDTIGSLEEGKNANVCIVNLEHDIPVVTCTLVKGAVVYNTPL